MKSEMKLFGKLHIVDILWALILVLLVFAAVQFSIPTEVSARQGDITIRYTIELGERVGQDGRRRLARTGFHENIRVGETVFDGINGQNIGTIVQVYALPFLIDTFDEDEGVIRRVPVDGFEYVYIVVEARAQVCDYETLVGVVPIQVGRAAFVRSKHFAGEGFVIAIEY